MPGGCELMTLGGWRDPPAALACMRARALPCTQQGMFVSHYAGSGGRLPRESDDGNNVLKEWGGVLSPAEKLSCVCDHADEMIGRALKVALPEHPRMSRESEYVCAQVPKLGR